MVSQNLFCIFFRSGIVSHGTPTVRHLKDRTQAISAWFFRF